MKNIFLVVFALFVSLISKGQANSQTMGNDSTVVTIKSIAKGNKGLIPGIFADTAAANSWGRVKTFQGLIIFTTGDNKTWIRNTAANAWLELASSAGTITALTNGLTLTGSTGKLGGTLTQNTTISGNNLYNTAFDAVSSFRAEANTGTGKISSVLVGTDSILFQPSDAIFIIDSLASGASTDSVLVWTQATGRVKKRAYSAFTPTWQQTLTAGSTLTGNNTINVAGYKLIFLNSSPIIIGTKARVDGGPGYSIRIVDDTDTSLELGRLLTDPNYNTGLGLNALKGITESRDGDWNVAIGAYALEADSVGAQNTAVGYGSLALNQGDDNTAIGKSAMAANTTGIQNTSIGSDALILNTSGGNNTAIGFGSLNRNLTGSNIIGVGYQSGYFETRSNKIHIGTPRTNTNLGTDTTTTAIYINDSDLKGYWNQDFIVPASYGVRFAGISAGAGRVLTSDATGNATWSTAPSALTLPISSLTAATGTNTINNASYNQLWNWASLAGATGLILTSSSNNSALDGDIVTNISFSGANPSSGATTYSLLASNSRTGTTSTNVGLKAFASGGTNNYAAIFNPGSVGIGTNAPTSLLHVVSTQTTGVGNQFSSSTTTSGSIMDITGTSTALAAGNEGLNIGISGANATNGITATGARISVTNTNATSGTNVALDLTASGATTANYALITNGGNVGIGTSTPTEILHVVGNIKGTNYIELTDVSAPSTPSSGFGRIYVRADSLRFKNDGGTEFTMGSGGITGSGTTNYLPKWTGASALGNSLVYDDGTNVGIGTTTPTERLHLFTSGSGSATRLIIEQGNNYYTAFYNDWGNSMWYTNSNIYARVQGQYGKTWLHVESDGSIVHINQDKNDMDFNVRGDTDDNLLYADASTDKIGIGTASPTTKLHVVGRMASTQGADVASVAGAISLGTDGNTFEITGTNAITLISNSGWVNGSEVTLLFTSTASLTDGTANSGTDIGMELAGNVNFTGSAGATLTLILSEIGGTQRWREKSRSVN